MFREDSLKPIQKGCLLVCWVDVNKGTKEVPKVRSRLVGHEFAHGQ